MRHSGEMKLQDLTMLSIKPLFRAIYNWWQRRTEDHFLICADIEEERAREALLNAAYFQKRAAMARSARN